MKKKVFPTPSSNLDFPSVSEVIENVYSRNTSDNHIDDTDLFKTFGTVHNYIYANDGLSTQQAFDEVLKVIFMKIEDEMHSYRKYNFFITEDEYYKISSGENTKFEKRIKVIFDKVKARYSDIFVKSDKIKLSNTSLAFTVKHFQNYQFKDAERDIKGAAFQKLVSNNLKGERGQFFTPDPVINFMVRITKPEVKTKFLDPACGTGGFLYSVIKFVRNNRTNKKGKIEISRQPFGHIKGMEINQSVARVAKLKLLLENFTSNAVLCVNSLLSWEELSKTAEKNSFGAYDFRNKYDLILTNPPFGSQGKITDGSFLNRFNLAYKWGKNIEGWNKKDILQDGQSPEILFLERCIDLLNNKGVLGIVLPNGIFENSSLSYIREYVRKHVKILAVISLPQETFMPHGTGVKASLLFVQKLSQKDLHKEIKNNYKIFFSTITKIGYKGNKNGTVIYKKDFKGGLIRDSEGKQVIDEDLSEIEACFKLFAEGKNVEKDNTFVVNYNDIEDRLDANYYKLEYKHLRRKLLISKAVRLKDVVEIVSQKSQQLKNPDVKIRYVELSDVNPFYSELISYKEIYAYEAPTRASYEIKEGWLITAVAGNSTGTRSHASALVTKEFDGCVCTNGFRVLIPKNINPFYLLSFLKSDLFLKQMYQKRTGAAIPAVSDEDLKNILVSLPPINEQKRIAKKIKESFKLRLQSRRLINNVSETFNSKLLKI